MTVIWFLVLNSNQKKSLLTNKLYSLHSSSWTLKTYSLRSDLPHNCAIYLLQIYCGTLHSGRANLQQPERHTCIITWAQGYLRVNFKVIFITIKLMLIMFTYWCRHYLSRWVTANIPRPKKYKVRSKLMYSLLNI